MGGRKFVFYFKKKTFTQVQIKMLIRTFNFRLAWDPLTNENTSYVLIPASKLWTPDLVVLNSADTSIFLGTNNNLYAMIFYSGAVSLVLNAPTLKTRCSMVLDSFFFLN
jgi:hypothetical protein